MKYTDPTGHYVTIYFAAHPIKLRIPDSPPAPTPSTPVQEGGDVTNQPTLVTFDIMPNSGDYAPGIPQNTSNVENRWYPGRIDLKGDYPAQVMEGESYNACGIVALAQIFDVDAIELYKSAKEVANVFDGTDVVELTAIVNNYAVDVSVQGLAITEDNIDSVLEELIRESINGGPCVMPMVTIDGTIPDGGSLLPDGEGALHWVVVTGISSQDDWANGAEWQWVEIYNPFHNQTEYYTWEDFTESFHAPDIDVEGMAFDNVALVSY